MAGERKDVVQPDDLQTSQTAVELLPSPPYSLVVGGLAIRVDFEHDGDAPPCGRLGTHHALPEQFAADAAIPLLGRHGHVFQESECLTRRQKENAEACHVSAPFHDPDVIFRRADHLANPRLRLLFAVGYRGGVDVVEFSECGSDAGFQLFHLIEL